MLMQSTPWKDMERKDVDEGIRDDPLEEPAPVSWVSPVMLAHELPSTPRRLTRG